MAAVKIRIYSKIEFYAFFEKIQKVKENEK